MDKRKFSRAGRQTALAAALLAAFSPAAFAAGFALMEQNASGLGNAYSGAAAVAEDASTIYFNPAGMTRLKGRQVVGALSVVSPKMEFTTATGVRSGGDGGETGVIPAAYLSWELTPDKLWLGVSLNSPFGLSTKWDPGWVGRYHAIESTVQALTINPSIAWKLSDAVSLGAGVSFQRMDATFSNAVSPTAVGTIEGDSWDFGWNVGLTWQATPATRFGAAYRSKISHTVEGDLTFSAPLPAVKVKSDVKLPDSFSLAVAHDLDSRWQILADWTWTGWDSIQALTIVTDPAGAPVSSTALKFKDSWRAGVGVNYRYDDKWTLRGGVALDNSPVQDAFRTPRLPDNDRVWSSLGAQYRYSRELAFDVGFAYLWISDASSNLSTPTPLVGTYKSSTWIASAQVRYNF